MVRPSTAVAALSMLTLLVLLSVAKDAGAGPKDSPKKAAGATTIKHFECKGEMVFHVAVVDDELHPMRAEMDLDLNTRDKKFRITRYVQLSTDPMGGSGQFRSQFSCLPSDSCKTMTWWSVEDVSDTKYTLVSSNLAQGTFSQHEIISLDRTTGRLTLDYATSSGTTFQGEKADMACAMSDKLLSNEAPKTIF